MTEKQKQETLAACCIRTIFYILKNHPQSMVQLYTYLREFSDKCDNS